MTSATDLLNQIVAALGTGVTSSYASSSAANDVFEGYVFALIVSAARNQGATVTFETVSGAATNHIVFRTSPGFIYSTTKPYTHARLAFPDCPELEVHVGVFVSGRSGIFHECDVAVLERDEAAFCRNERVHPRHNKVPMAVECKFHAGTLQLGQARAFLGLTEEIAKTERYLVTNTASVSAERMIVHHKVEKEFQLDLITPRVSEAFQFRLERFFRNFKVARSI